MRVTLISMVFPHPIPGIWPGIERAVGELARALVKEGVEVTVLTTRWNGGPESETWEGIRILRLPDSSRRWGKAAYLFSWNIRSFASSVLGQSALLRGSDAVHTFVALPRADEFRRLGVPLFASFPHREKPRRLADRLILAGRFDMERRFLAAADGIFAGSAAARDVLVADYALEPSGVLVVPLAVDGDRFTPGPDGGGACRSGESQDGIRLLYVGPLIPRKGLHTLIQSLPALRQASISFRLRLVGEGPEEGALRAMARSLGVEGMVDFEGFVEEERLVGAYREADLFVFPSLQEGFGLVLVEAMACGLPVIATGVAPMTEVVGDAGLFFPPEDAPALSAALMRVAADPELRSDLSRRGRERVETRYLWRRVAMDSMAEYRKGREPEARSA